MSLPQLITDVQSTNEMRAAAFAAAGVSEVDQFETERNVKR